MEHGGYHSIFLRVIYAGLIGVFVFGNFLIWHTVFAANSSSLTSKVTVPSSVPTITNVKLNANNAITLTANATTSFNISYTVTDGNGCEFIQNISSTAFRVGVLSTCEVEAPTTSNLNCYAAVTHTTSSCISSSQLNGTDTVDIYYFAQATDASSSFATDSWEAYVVAKDSNAVTSSYTNATSSSVALNTLNAIAVTTTTINYGQVTANTNTGTTNQFATTTNAGNSTTTLQLYALQTLMNGTVSIATSNQVFATSSFTYGSGVTSTAIGDGVGNIATLGPGTVTSSVNGFIITAPTSTATSSYARATYWGLAVPNGQASGSYTGTTVFQSLFKP